MDLPEMPKWARNIILTAVGTVALLAYLNSLHAEKVEVKQLSLAVEAVRSENIAAQTKAEEKHLEAMQKATLRDKRGQRRSDAGDLKLNAEALDYLTRERRNGVVLTAAQVERLEYLEGKVPKQQEDLDELDGEIQELEGALGL